MKFTFKSEQYGTVVDMSFEAVTLSEIEEMYKQFLRGSGFYLVEDEDDMSTKQENSDTSEERVHEVDMAYRPNGLTVEQAKPWVGLDDNDFQYQTPQYALTMKFAEAILKDKNK